MAQPFASLIRRLFWIFLGLALVFFSVNNRTPISLSFEPFDFSVPIPVYGLLFAGVFIGLLLAAGATGWLRLKGFAKRRKAERRATYLEDQVTALAEDAHKAHASDAHRAAAAEAAADPTEPLPKPGKDE